MHQDESPLGSSRGGARGAAQAEAEAPRAEAGSFRDPDTRVFYANGRVLRALSARALEDWEALTESGLYEELRRDGRIVATEPFEDRALWPQGEESAPLDGCAGVVAHEAVPFISYPYEWPFSMLKDAARLQLEILAAALERDMTMKDATPYNVQFRGARPVFIDVGSFEPLVAGRPWLGYRQFCMQFLYPLLLAAYRGVSFRPWLRGSLEGISPAECAALLPRRDRMRRGVFTHVGLHARLERRYAASTKVRSELKDAGFNTELIKANVKRLSKLVDKLEWNPAESEWSEYGTINEYRPEDSERKARFVAEAARERAPDLVWDLGCNDGTYSLIAAEHARRVVAVDGDELLIDNLYRRLRDDGDERVLPLAMQLTDPSPGLGWRGLERRSLADRGRPDLTLCLALLHHVSITGNVPVADFIDWLAGLGSSLVIEFVTREDPMVELLLSRKEAGSHPDYERSAFERRLAEAFSVDRTEPICEGRRVLYLAHPRS